jgi:hypothetical protein
MYYQVICLEVLRKITESLRIADVPSEIQTGCLSNTT